MLNRGAEFPGNPGSSQLEAGKHCTHLVAARTALEQFGETTRFGLQLFPPDRLVMVALAEIHCGLVAQSHQEYHEWLQPSETWNLASAI